mgnify:CR=1 FL=1
MQRTQVRETLITLLIRISGYSSILFVSAILFFLLREGLPALGDVELSSLFGARWYPIESLYDRVADYHRWGHADLAAAGSGHGHLYF